MGIDRIGSEKTRSKVRARQELKNHLQRRVKRFHALLPEQQIRDLHTRLKIIEKMLGVRK